MNIIYTGEKDTRLYKNVLGETISQILADDPRAVYLDADLMSCIGTAKLPGKTERAIDCGIAEANMIGIACGLSAVGMHPIAHTFGPFASRRCFDQIFLSGGYAKNSVTVIGTDPGVTAAFNGGTHMPFEDMALYRTIPDAIVVDVTDVSMLVSFLRQFQSVRGVKYLRVGRKESYPVYPADYDFQIGKGAVLRTGSDAVIVASGIMVHEALQAAEELERAGISAAVIDPVTVKPLDEALIRSWAEKTGALVTAENHNRIGGLTSAVQAAVCGMPLRFGVVAVEDCFGEVGPQSYLQERFGLTAGHIVQTTKAALDLPRRQ